MATAATRPQTLPSLYRLLLRTSQSTFKGDTTMISAWKQYVRTKLPAQVQQKGGASQQLNDELVAEWLDVVKMLRMNVVQGVRQADGETYSLRFTQDTELGSNDSIKKQRQDQLNNLKATKGSVGCGGASSSRPSTSSSSFAPSGSRPFSTSIRLLDPRDPERLKVRPAAPVPHPPPHFPSTAILADGSSIQLSTTSPRSISRLTRDPTNHPLWNPRLEGRGAGGGEDEAGRMERFRKRFGSESEAEAVAEDDPSLGMGQMQGETRAASKAIEQEARKQGTTSPTSRRKGMFEMDDLDWMSGGRQAKAGSQVRPGGAKGKGKK